jgi:hypothetical protein
MLPPHRDVIFSFYPHLSARFFPFPARAMWFSQQELLLLELAFHDPAAKFIPSSMQKLASKIDNRKSP